MAIINSFKQFKNSRISIGTKYVKCTICGEETTSKRILMVPDNSTNQNCICSTCLKELAKLIEQ